MYLSRNSRSGIQFAVYQCDMFTHNPIKSHDEEVKRIYRYLVVKQGKVLTFNWTDMWMHILKEFGNTRMTKIMCV